MTTYYDQGLIEPRGSNYMYAARYKHLQYYINRYRYRLVRYWTKFSRIAWMIFTRYTGVICTGNCKSSIIKLMIATLAIYTYIYLQYKLLLHAYIT